MEENKPIAVMIVDDEDRFRATTTATLKRRGFMVMGVGSGEEAVEEVKKGECDVVVLDVKMPGMDGHRALREIKKLKPDTEVIMLTAYGSMDSALEGLREGVFAYLAKPCDVDLLALRIREAFSKRKGVARRERRVKDVLVPFTSFAMTVRQDQTVGEAVELILKCFDKTVSGKFSQSMHRPILVTDEHDAVVGVVSFTDFLRGLQPPCMKALSDRPTMSGSIYLEPSGFLGSFDSKVRDMASRKIREVLPKKPPTIDADSDLMDATNMLVSLGVQVLLVMEGGKATGVIRDKDIFLEMADIIREHRAQLKA